MLDYGIGNLRSAEKALQRVGADAALVADPEVAREAAGIVLPGVGNFGRCMVALRETGLDGVALEAVEDGRPFLGICVGMQMLYEGSDESPGEAGLGVLPGQVRLLPAGVKRPQMQWNRLHPTPGRAGHPLLAGVGSEPWVYFVHSYAAPVGAGVVATCAYGGDVVAAVGRGPLWATQFHPEKSGLVGLAMLANFAAAVTAGSGAGAPGGPSGDGPAWGRGPHAREEPGAGAPGGPSGDGPAWGGGPHAREEPGAGAPGGPM